MAGKIAFCPTRHCKVSTKQDRSSPALSKAETTWGESTQYTSVSILVQRLDERRCHYTGAQHWRFVGPNHGAKAHAVNLAAHSESNPGTPKAP